MLIKAPPNHATVLQVSVDVAVRKELVLGVQQALVPRLGGPRLVGVTVRVAACRVFGSYGSR